LDNSKLSRTIDLFWKSKSRNDIYFLGRCADFAYALQKFLHGGELFLVGKQPTGNVAWHVVVKYNDKYWDVRGSNTLEQIRQRNPIIAFNGDDNTVSKATASDMAHIHKLLNHDFVEETINGLKEASKKG
jgi:hypothetical protein